jgi:hypothetical protein
MRNTNFFFLSTAETAFENNFGARLIKKTLAAHPYTITH